MSRRVYEIAKDLGLSGQELTDKINAMSLGYQVNNHMSTITDDQEVTLLREMERQQRANMVEERLSATVIRRKPRRKVVSDVVEEESVKVEEAAAPDKKESEAEVAQKQAEEGDGVNAVEEAGAEAATEDVPEESGEETSSQDQPDAKKEDSKAVKQEVVSRPAKEDIMAVLAKQSSSQQAVAEVENENKSAQVVGSLSPELLQQRLAADRKTFKTEKSKSADSAKSAVPGEKGASDKQPFYSKGEGGGYDGHRKKKKQGRRVYGASELYDRRKGGRRRPQNKKTKTGASPTPVPVTQTSEHKRVIKMEDVIRVGDLAHQMGVKAGEIALKLMLDLGISGANINTPLDLDTATLIAESYTFTVEEKGFDLERYLPKTEGVDAESQSRSPVVTVMGHVDHGKTSLLDAIRESNVASGESGGITQHIGAYKVELESGNLTFLDTPGHEAFTALRARGAQATDIVILVVAADDGVMPQTIEAINHSKDAGVPIIVAINKIDKHGANTERIMQGLTEYELIPESWGGDSLFQEVSALEGTGISELLESVLLQAEVLELKAKPDLPAQGIVIESRLDTGRGPVATLLVRDGTLKSGDILAVGKNWGRVRTMNDERMQTLEVAGPSTPVEVTGLDGVPTAGETFYVVEDERSARAISSHLVDKSRQKGMTKTVAATADVDSITELLEAGELKELKVILKADVQGSQEALEQALVKASSETVVVKVVHSAVGGITENDVNLAASSESGAIIVGFNVRPELRAAQHAQQLGISVMTFQVIYDAVDAIRNLLSGLLDPVFEESVLGRVEIRETFNIPKVGTIAGCYVTDGKIQRSSRIRVLRDNIVIYESKISSLKRFKDDVKEVKQGFECGLSVENFNDVKVGDTLEVFEVNEVEQTL